LSDEYVAGLFDGEGTVSVYCFTQTRKSGNSYRRYQLTVVLTNTHRPVLDRIRVQYGGFIVKHQSRMGRRQCYRWMASAHIAQRFLSAIQPYAIIKRPVIDLGLELRGLVEGRRGWNEGRVSGQRAELSAEEVDARRRIRDNIFAINHGQVAS
jgi:hypothetical protein